MRENSGGKRRHKQQVNHFNGSVVDMGMCANLEKKHHGHYNLTMA